MYHRARGGARAEGSLPQIKTDHQPSFFSVYIFISGQRMSDRPKGGARAEGSVSQIRQIGQIGRTKSPF